MRLMARVGQNKWPKLGQIKWPLTDCEQVGICQPFGTFGEESFARAFVCGPVPNPFRTHVAFLSIRIIDIVFEQSEC